MGGKRREIGLGGYPGVTLAQARDRARDAKDKIRQGVDPVEGRKAARAALVAARSRALTFAEATERFLAIKLEGMQNKKNRDQWRNTLKTYAMPELGKMAVQDIAVQDVLRMLEPIWQKTTVTAKRVRTRTEAVLTWATVAGYRTGDNPARWAGNLKELLPSPSKLAKPRNQPAVQINDAPRWFAALRAREGIGSRCLEFVALTAARSGEARGATWEEIDLEAGLWIIPAARMKMDRKHTVPLSPETLALLQALPRFADNPLVFPAPRGGTLSDMTLSGTMKRIHAAELAAGRPGYLDRVSKSPAVPHGLRSTFRDWVAERTHFPGDMAEMALAHKIPNASEASYRRQQMVEKRRAMMTAWSDFLNGEPTRSTMIDPEGFNGRKTISQADAN